LLRTLVRMAKPLSERPGVAQPPKPGAVRRPRLVLTRTSDGCGSCHLSERVWSADDCGRAFRWCLPRPSRWALTRREGERVTGIEPALSAWKLMFRTSRFLTEQAMMGNTAAQMRLEVRLAATRDALPL
jgi:hypothetical protein